MDEVVQRLDEIISEELRLYTEYQQILSQEREALRTSDLDRIQVLAAERGIIVDGLSIANDERRALIRETTKERHHTLTQFIQRFVDTKDQKPLLKKAEALRAAVKKCRSDSSEFSQVVNFALKIASGVVSILWSASQSVVRSYGRTGTIKEAYHPSQGHAASVLKKV